MSWFFSSPNRKISNITLRGNALANPADGFTYNLTAYPDGNFGSVQKVYFPIRNIIKAVIFNTYANTVAGSAESISVYLRINNTTDYLIGTIATVGPERKFLRNDLNIVMNENDFFEFKMVCPTWVTNPTNMFISWVLYAENE